MRKPKWMWGWLLFGKTVTDEWGLWRELDCQLPWLKFWSWLNRMQSSTLFSWVPKLTADSDCSYEIKRCLLLGRKAMTNLGSVLKSRDITLPTKVCIVKAMLFPVVMYEYESWTIKKPESQRIDAFKLWFLEKTSENHLGTKEIKPVHPKGNQPWLFIGRTDAEAEAPILWPPDLKNWLLEKDPDAGKDWRQEKGMTEDEMVG